MLLAVELQKENLDTLEGMQLICRVNDPQVRPSDSQVGHNQEDEDCSTEMSKANSVEANKSLK